jgi:uncharacterized protein with GYD domain
MPAYVSLSKFTEQGKHSIKETVNRTQQLKKQAEAAGGRVIGVWWLMGEYDAIMIFEAPDEATAMRMLIANGMQGNTHSTTLRAFSEDEMAKIVAALP